MTFKDFKEEMYRRGYDYLDLIDDTINFINSHWNKRLYVKFRSLTGVYEDDNKLSKARYSIRDVLCTMFDHFLNSLNRRCNSSTPLFVAVPLFLQSIWSLLDLDDEYFNADWNQVLNNR